MTTNAAITAAWRRLAAADPVGERGSGELTDAVAAARRLERIVETPVPGLTVPRSRFSRPRLALALAATMLILTAATSASGLVSDIVRDKLGYYNGSEAGDFRVQVDRARRVATVGTPDGGRLELWVAPARKGGRCEAVLAFTGPDDDDPDGGSGCELGPLGKVGFSGSGDDVDGGYLYVWGPPRTARIDVKLKNGRILTLPTRRTGYALTLVSAADIFTEDIFGGSTRVVARDKLGRVLARE